MQAQLERAEQKLETGSGKLSKVLIVKTIRELRDELKMPEFPKPLGYLWQTYLRIRKRVAIGMSGPDPISWPDIDAFVNRTGLKLTEWELRAIERIDNSYVSPSSAPSKPEVPEGKTLKQLAAVNDLASVRAVLGSVGKRQLVVRKRKKKHG